MAFAESSLMLRHIFHVRRDSGLCSDKTGISTGEKFSIKCTGKSVSGKHQEIGKSIGNRTDGNRVILGIDRTGRGRIAVFLRIGDNGPCEGMLRAGLKDGGLAEQFILIRPF